MTDVSGPVERTTLRRRLSASVGAWPSALRRRRTAAHLLALAITLFGALLRLDAFVAKYGTVDHPAWARVATQHIAPLAGAVSPERMNWPREARPFVGGDPINYLKYAREMESFYQPHVREPVYLALTRASLWAMNNQDVGISLASGIGSTTAVFATYLLGAALLSPLVGLLAALFLAIEFEAITWAPDGWRDDTFTATVLLCAWAFLRLRRHPSTARAIVAGTLAAAACLTRITALSFILPAAIWYVVEGPRGDWRRRARDAGIAAAVCALLVAPYLISCAIATGDPFLAINYHTVYYRHAEGWPVDQPMGVADYLRAKFVDRPVATLDVGFNGIAVQPFGTKWNGLDLWLPGLSRVLQTLSLAGLALLPFTPAGRLFLVMLTTSLLPYTFTWNLGDGGAWRFTMHAYPFYLVAGSAAVVLIARAVRNLIRLRARPRTDTVVSMAWKAAVVAVVGFTGVALYYGLPWFVAREAIAKGDSTSLETGARDRVFYRDGWSPPHRDGVTVRVSRAERASVRVPLPEQRDYDIVLRIDPVVPGTQERVDVLFNRYYVGALRLTWNPERVGSYRIPVRASMVRVGSNEVTIIPDELVEASAGGPRFGWLDPAERVGVRLWYIRVLPLAR
jgi:hypothetical protein